MSKKRFRCRIGLHDWQRVPGSETNCGKCYKCFEIHCDHPLWDKVCIAPGCRATRLKATKRKAHNQRAKELKADRDQKAKELQKERENLAALKMELIKDEEV